MDNKLKALTDRERVLHDVCSERLERVDRLTAQLHDRIGTISTTQSLIKLMYSTRTASNDTMDALISAVDSAGAEVIRISKDLKEARAAFFNRMNERSAVQNEIDKIKSLQTVADTAQPKIKIRNSKK